MDVDESRIYPEKYTLIYLYKNLKIFQSVTIEISVLTFIALLPLFNVYVCNYYII